jgi:hypothetical protein
MAAALAMAAVSCSSDGDDGASPTTAAREDTSSTTTTTAPAAPLERYADYESISYDDPDHWVCRPGRDDICAADLDATAVAPDGTLTVEPFEPDPDAAVDCFYVYPTISQDRTQFSDWEADDGQEGFVTQNQAARLQASCRLFAPVYRQLTVRGLTGSAEPGGETVNPYDDILDAFRTYLAQDNGGRGFVLIGHSQGALFLRNLIQNEIDPNPDVRDLLVGAYLAGTRVNVPEGELVGGDFDNIPLCSGTDEAGCITTWASWLEPAAPTLTASGDGAVAACSNPVDPGATGPTPMDAYFTAATGGAIGPGDDGEGGGVWAEGADEEITTPFVRLTGLAEGGCTNVTGGSHLAVTLAADPDDPRADDLPGARLRGGDLHLLDVNLVMGDLLVAVERQARTHLAGR